MTEGESPPGEGRDVSKRFATRIGIREARQQRRANKLEQQTKRKRENLKESPLLPLVCHQGGTANLSGKTSAPRKLAGDQNLPVT